MATKPLRIDGFDLSHFQDQHIDYAAAKRAGAKFLYHKATEGTSFVDGNYAERRREAKAAGLLFGAYHFARPSLAKGDAVAQAKHFLSVAKPKPGDMLPVLDLEVRGGLTTPELTRWADDFFAHVSAATGTRKNVLYTPFDLNSVPKGTRLWVARYSDSNAAPHIPKPFKRFAIHQFSDGKFGRPDTLHGVGNVDLNHLRDGLFGLAKLAWKRRLTIPAAKPTPPPPPPKPNPVRHRVSTFNAEFGHRPQERWAEMILARFEKLQLDVFSINEAQDYFAELKVLAEAAGHQLFGHGKDSRNGLLVRNGLKTGPVGTVPGHVPTWKNPRGHTMSMPQPVVVEVDGVTYASIHGPVDAWEAHPSGGRTLDGPPARVAAYKAFVTNLVSFAKTVTGPFFVLGDWNAAPGTVGTFSPEWVREQIKADFFRPNATTGHGEIDFGIVRGAKSVGKVTVVPHADFLVKGETGGSESGQHSDHLQIYGDVVYPG